MPGCPRPPAENIWWFDLNVLSPTPFSPQCEMSNQIAECTVKVVRLSPFIPRFAIFVRKRELCASALWFSKDWVTTNLLAENDVDDRNEKVCRSFH